MVARAVAAVALVALTVACGNDDGRKSVSAYIDDVNAIQQRSQASLADVSRVYQEFSRGAKFASLEARLLEAERTFADVERRLRRLEPPDDARRLHRALLRLVDAEVELADEVERMARFLPAYERALRPLQPANARLRKALSSSATGTKQAIALDAYRKDIGVVVSDVGELDPPSALLPLRATQVQTLTRVRATAAQLARALRAQDREGVAKLSAQLVDAAQSGQALPAQRARIAAVKAYNGRVRQTRELTKAVARELQRLERSL